MTPIPLEVQGYIDLVESGRVRACKEQHQLIALVKRVFETEDLFYDVEQIEKYLSYQKYFPFVLFDWEKFCFVLHNCVFQADGLPRWPDLFILVGRGGGKNAYLAYEDFCLVTETNGIKQYDIDICANSEDQAKTTFMDIHAVLENPKNRKRFKKHFRWNLTEIINLKTGSRIKYRTNNPKGKDGLRSGKVDFDEPHAYTDWDNINVFTTGLGKKPHPRRSYVSTNGDVRDGPLDQLIEKSEKILSAEMPDDGFLPFISRVDNEDEVHDPANWEKANPSLPFLPTLMAQMKREYADYILDPIRNHAFMTKRMNRPHGNKEIEVASWENILRTKGSGPMPDLRGRSCVCGIDFSKTTDFVSVFLLFKIKGQFYGIHHSWFCVHSADKHRIRIPLDEMVEKGLVTMVNDVEILPEMITDWLREQARYYYIQKISLDHYRHALFAKALRAIGYDANEGRVKMIRPSDIMQVVQKISSAFLNGRIIWGDDPMMRWYTNNTKLEPAPNNNFKYGKIEPRSRKTDGFMAFVAAMCIEDELPDYDYDEDFEELPVFAF